ncbi:MAG: sarcosine oxidase subunit gamma [Rubrobacteraceae bacterium]
MAEFHPVARSPISPAPPTTVVDGWEVGARRSGANLCITDCAPLSKILVRADEDGAVSHTLGVPFGRAVRDENGILVIGFGPGEWMLIGPPGTAAEISARVEAMEGGDPASVVDLTHGRAMIQLTGERSAELLAKVCAINLSDEAIPDGGAFRSSVAKLASGVARDDRDGERSYLIHCERSYGQYLFDSLLDAGEEFGIEIDGFPTTKGR